MKLLVFRFSSLGDVAITVPAIASALELNSDLELVIVTRKAFVSLFKGLPRTQIHPFDPNEKHKGLLGLNRLKNELLRDFQPDAIVDLHNVLRTQVLRAFFKLHGVPSYKYKKDRAGRKALTQQENRRTESLRHTVEEYLKVFEKSGLKATLQTGPWLGKEYSKTHTGIIGLAPLASSRQKTWPLEKSTSLVKQLSSEGKEVWLFGGPGEIEQLKAIQGDAENVVIIPEKSKGIRDDIQLIRQLDVMVSMDSANMHLAALSGVPTVSIWGATHPNAGFSPLGDYHSYIQIDQRELDCRPCSIFGQKTCARRDWACLERIKVSDVSEVLEKFNA